MVLAVALLGAMLGVVCGAAACSTCVAAPPGVVGAKLDINGALHIGHVACCALARRIDICEGLRVCGWVYVYYFWLIEVVFGICIDR